MEYGLMQKIRPHTYTSIGSHVNALQDFPILFKYRQPKGVLLARIGTGSLWKDVLKAIPQTKYHIIHGQCQTVGVGGFVLKGGINMVRGSSLYGSGASNVVRYRTVDARGDILDVDENGVTRYGQLIK